MHAEYAETLFAEWTGCTGAVSGDAYRGDAIYHYTLDHLLQTLTRLEAVLDRELADELPSDDARVRVVRRVLRSVLSGDLPEAAD